MHKGELLGGVLPKIAKPTMTPNKILKANMNTSERVLIIKVLIK
jgi:hypothetical protein